MCRIFPFESFIAGILTGLFQTNQCEHRIGERWEVWIWHVIYGGSVRFGERRGVSPTWQPKHVGPTSRRSPRAKPLLNSESQFPLLSPVRAALHEPLC